MRTIAVLDVLAVLLVTSRAVDVKHTAVDHAVHLGLKGLGFRGFRVESFGFRVQGLRFRF